MQDDLLLFDRAFNHAVASPNQVLTKYTLAEFPQTSRFWVSLYSFQADSRGDESSCASCGHVIIGQHSAASIKLLGVSRMPYTFLLSVRVPHLMEIGQQTCLSSF